jgi:methionine-rich copper-binding protein CopC
MGPADCRGRLGVAARVLAVLLGAATLGLGATGPAAAHVSLVGSSPPDGAQLSAFPAEVMLSFSQRISPPAYVVVTAPDGRSLVRGAVSVHGSSLTVRTGGSRAPGRYLVAYRVVSEDGHPISGRLTAVVGPGSPARAPAATGAATGAASPEAATSPAAAVAPRGADGAAGRRQPSPGFWLVGAGLFVLAGLLAGFSRRQRVS